jgi:hypothetical protein
MATINSIKNLLTYPQTIHNKYLNLPPLAKTTLWAALGAFAVEGLRQTKEDNFITDLIYIPIFEEIAFRGIVPSIIHKGQEIWNRYRKTNMDESSTRNRVVASSLIFGAAHTSSLQSAVENTWNLGRAAGYLGEATGSLFAPLGIHMLTNLIAITSLRRYIPAVVVYPPIFYALQKKPLPIPDCVTSTLKNLCAQVAHWIHPSAKQKKKAMLISLLSKKHLKIAK